MSIHYITKRIKDNKFLDENGDVIKNKFGYFKSALESNFRKLNGVINCDDEYNWLEDNEDLLENIDSYKSAHRNNDMER